MHLHGVFFSLVKSGLERQHVIIWAGLLGDIIRRDSFDIQGTSNGRVEHGVFFFLFVWFLSFPFFPHHQEHIPPQFFVTSWLR